MACDPELACAPELVVASGGDSHTKRIMREIQDELRRGNFPSLRILYNGGRPTWASGGCTMPRYLTQQHRRLCECSANVVIFTIGGNDCDQVTPVDLRALNRDIRRVVTELEQSGKRVFVCQSPRRWTVRSTPQLTVEQHKKLGNDMDRFMRRNMPRNYIHLPPGGQHFHRDNFEEENFGHGVEVVHLKREHYNSYANYILQQILINFNN